MPGSVDRLGGRLGRAWSRLRCWWRLRRCVTGKIKLRGDTSRMIINPDFRCDGDLWLGVHSDAGRIVIGPGVSASGPLVITAIRPLTIGAGTLFGPNVLVTDHYHGDLRNPAHRALLPSDRPLHSPGPITIEEGVQLGANAVVLSPAQIGSGVIVAANAVVKGQVAPSTVYTGIAVQSARPDQRADQRD
jgi:acetyltransferase-like isoleucine patch superfamily enzyme